jgi:hypothetical protein
MGIDTTRVKLTKTRFNGIIPGTEATPTGKVTLDMVIGTPENYHFEPLEFKIVPF